MALPANWIANRKPTWLRWLVVSHRPGPDGRYGCLSNKLVDLEVVEEISHETTMLNLG